MITKRCIVLVLIVFLQSANVVISQTVPTPFSDQTLKKIEQIEKNISFVKFQIKGKPRPTLEDRMAFYHVNGLSIAVINNYEIEWAKGYGWADLEEGRIVTTETRFEPGSISKSLNALGILKLVQDKKIDLNKDINLYLHSWRFPYDTVSKNKKITTANLLSHTAGLNMHGFPGYIEGDSLPAIAQILDGKFPANTEAVRSTSEPGLKYQYSGGGTMISQLITMNITNQSYDKFMEENILRPIGMTNSSFTQPPPKKYQHLLATGYTVDGKAIKGKHPILVEQAAGGLWTTPTDLAKFIIEIQRSLQGKSNKILNKELTKKMLTPYIDQRAGLGVFIEQIGSGKYFQHSAGNLGFSGKYYGSMAGGNGVVVFINSDTGVEIIDEILTTVALTYNWKGVGKLETPIVKEEVILADSILEKYTGIYREKNTFIGILKKDNALWYNVAGKSFKIYFTSPVHFINLEVKTEKQFYIDIKGEVKGFLRSMENKQLGKVEKIELVNLPDHRLQQYTGRYSDGHGYEATLKIKDSELWMEAEGLSKKINFLSPTDFFTLDDAGVLYNMIINSLGKPEAIRIRNDNNQLLLNKID